MSWLALDIGGANIKLADGRGFADSQSFAMWKDHRRLAWELRTIIAGAPPSDHLAITMTGELADCFLSRAEGVNFILESARDAADGRHTRVYLVDGRLVAPPVALRSPALVASANWHALARYCTRFVPDRFALLIDIGSTTVDLIPLSKSGVANTGTTDRQRLGVGELVYTGIERSPVCALVQALEWDGQRYPVAQEVFATARDVHLLLGQLPEAPECCDTADHQPATLPAAQRRLARMVCADADQLPMKAARLLASQVAEAQLQLLTTAARGVLQRCREAPHTVIVSGHGDFLARQLLERLSLSVDMLWLDQQLGPIVSRSATAHALAVLASEGP